MNNLAGFGQGQGGNGGGGGDTSCGDKIAQCWAGVPLFCRFLFWSSIGIYLISFIYGPILYYTFNIPSYVYTQFQIWRIITAPLANKDIFMLLFGLCSYISRGMQVERMKGTNKFFIYFWWMSILSQIILVILDLIVNLITSWMSLSLGLWTMVMVDMTIDSLKQPDLARNLCCLPIQIKSKYYPYIFLVIFGLLFPPAFFALLAGYLTGVLHSFGYLKFTEPSDNLVNKVHNLIFKRFEDNPAFVSQANAMGDDGAGEGGGLPMFVRQPQQNQPMPPPGQPRGDSGDSTSKPVTPFAGKGVSVGTGATGYQGSNSNTYAAPQNVREQPAGPNPNIKNSKLIKEHEQKAKQNEDDSDDDQKIENVHSNESNNEDQDLL